MIDRARRAATKLVLADDDHRLLQALRELLSEAGYTVLGVAPDGPEAVEMADELRPDVLIVDHRMPGLSGADVATVLKARVPGLPVIILSAYDDAGLQVQAERIPVAAYLVKGCSARVMFSAIDNAAARSTSV